jgi:hypothetical protein
MDWVVWSAVAQIVGSAAVVVTLIYLTRQIRQNTDAMQAAAREAIAERDVEWLYKLVDYPELGLLFRKEEPPAELDASRMNASLVAFMRIREANFRQYKSGVLDEATWMNYRSSIVNGPLSQPLARVWWSNFGRKLFDPELSEQISKDLLKAPLMPPFSTLFSPADPEGSGIP